jgi:hypothetical protein
VGPDALKRWRPKPREQEPPTIARWGVVVDALRTSGSRLGSLLVCAWL